jgi:hypothetical protein
METETNAGGASASAPEPMTVADGEARLLGLLEGPKPEAEKVESPEPAAPEAPSEPEAQEAETSSADDTPKDEPLDFEKLHGNTRLRLRDGSEVTVGELKKRYGELQEIPRRSQEFEAQRQALEQRQAQFAQQEQFVSQVLPIAIQMATENLPPEPHPDLLHTDPMLHYEMSNRRAQAVVKLQQLHHAQLAGRQQLQQRTQAEMAQYLKAERERLIEALPELKDSAKAQAFQSEIVQTARHYGFTDQDIAQVYDHRLLKMAKDAAAYRKIMAAKPKVEAKAQNAPPVATPGKRASPSEQKGRDRTDQLQRLKETGSRQLAEKLIEGLL